MQLADTAWQEVDTTTIQNCWHKAGILPNASSILTIDQAIDSHISIPILTLLNYPNTNFNSISLAEEAISKTLDKLQETGVLQEANCMSIEQLLNPVEEQSLMVEDISDEDICNAVLETIGNSSSGADPDDTKDHEDVVPHPTHHEALAAALTLQRYVQDIDTPYAWDFESSLVSFGHQTWLDGLKTMQDTKISDYFIQKS